MTSVHPGLVLEGYEFVERIGEGGFSSVYLVRSLQYQRPFVAKVTCVKNENVDRAWKVFDSEVQALLILDHPNIINLYAHFRYGDNFILILEYCPNGSLEDYIKSHGRVPSQMLVSTVCQICSALRYAWSIGIQHRDIKPANIMFNEAGFPKLCDFGISLRQTEEGGGGDVVDFRCSKVCAAPEILRCVPHDPVKSDIWALGVTILWAGNGAVPWPVERQEELQRLVQYGQYIVPKGMNKALLKIVKFMMNTVPGDRKFPEEEELEGLSASVGVSLKKDTAVMCHSLRAHGQRASMKLQATMSMHSGKIGISNSKVSMGHWGTRSRIMKGGLPGRNKLVPMMRVRQVTTFTNDQSHLKQNMGGILD